MVLTHHLVNCTFPHSSPLVISMMSQQCSAVVRCTSMRLYSLSCCPSPPVTSGHCRYGASSPSNRSVLLKNSSRASSSNPVYSALHSQQQQAKQTPNEQVYQEGHNPTSPGSYQSQRISMTPLNRSLSASELSLSRPLESIRVRHSNYFSNIRHSMNSNFSNANLSTNSAVQMNPMRPLNEATSEDEPQSEFSADSSSDDSRDSNFTGSGSSRGKSNGNARKSNLWTSSLSKSINYFYNQKSIDAEACKVCSV